MTKDMIRAREAFDRHRQERYEQQRIQEAIERDLNARLLTVDALEDEAASGNPEIGKRSISFEGVDIPVFDLKGYSFSILSTTIDYRSANNPGDIGTETYREVLANPAIWAERRDEAEKASGFGTRNSNARGDTISTSYWNSEQNIDSHVRGKLIYGFEHVDGDSVIHITNGDGGTVNTAGQYEADLYDLRIIDKLEGAGGTGSYNELLLRRYTDNGVSKKPDYIIVEDGAISEEALRHAKYFGIPIINIERSVYDKKAEKRGEMLINSINEKDDYEELDKKIATIRSMSKYKSEYIEPRGIGRKYDVMHIVNPTPLEEKCLEISKIEQIKRIEFVKNTLEKAIEEIELATEKGVVASHILSQFEHFNVWIIDVWNKTYSTESGDIEDSSWSAPGNCNWINVDFRLKGSSRNVETRIYDGEKVIGAIEAQGGGEREEGDIERADSSYYDALEPVVRRYFEALRKNRELEKTE